MFDEDFDKAKSLWNKVTRGIDFVEARMLWDDPEAIEGPATSKDEEERWLRVGQAKGRLWTVGFTYRKSAIRIFMVRPSRKEEKDVYYESI